MQITDEQVKRISQLAKLDLSAEDIGRIRLQLQELLDYAAVVADASSMDIAVIQGQSPGPRSGVPVSTAMTQEDVLVLAPESCQGMIRVPRVMGHE